MTLTTIITGKGGETSKSLEEIPVGQWFYATSPCRQYEGLFLRSYDTVVYVEDPQKTWRTNYKLTCFNYSPVGEVEIRTKGEGK